MFMDTVGPAGQVAAIVLSRRTLLGFSVIAAAAPLVARGADVSLSSTATIAQFHDALLADMKIAKTVDFQHRFEMLQPAIDQVFDLEAVLALSVGLRWASFSPDQQARLLAAFRRYTVASYVSGFNNYTGQIFSVLPDVRDLGAGEVVVRSRIEAAGKDVTKLDYVMRQTPSGWKIVDVLADGSISRVAVQRSDFRTVLANGGGDALLARLRLKTSDLSGGMLS
jgi:phospholipid transport system substrate-binding protein